LSGEKNPWEESYTSSRDDTKQKKYANIGRNARVLKIRNRCDKASKVLRRRYREPHDQIVKGEGLEKNGLTKGK